MATFSQALQRLSGSDFRSRLNDFTTAPNMTYDPQYAFYQQNPDVVYEAYLNSLGGSNADTAALRQAYGSIFNRFMDSYASGFPGTAMLTFADFLGGLNPNQELARLGPAARGRFPARFQRPSRWFAF